MKNPQIIIVIENKTCSFNEASKISTMEENKNLEILLKKKTKIRRRFKSTIIE